MNFTDSHRTSQGATAGPHGLRARCRGDVPLRGLQMRGREAHRRVLSLSCNGGLLSTEVDSLLVFHDALDETVGR